MREKWANTCDGETDRKTNILKQMISLNLYNYFVDSIYVYKYNIYAADGNDYSHPV